MTEIAPELFDDGPAVMASVSEISPTVGRKLRAVGVVVASTVGTTLSATPVVGAVFGMMMIPIAAEFGWSRVEVSSAIALMTFSTAASFPFAGWLCDRIGPRLTIIIGTLALGLCVLGLAFARPIPVLFYLQFILTGIAGSLPSAVVFGKLLGEWFDKTRALCMGISGMGNGIGVTIFPLLVAALLPHGWRFTYVCIGLIVLLIGGATQFFLLRDAPVQKRAAAAEAAGLDRPLPGMTLGQAMRTGRFWLLLTGMPLASGALMAAGHMTVPQLVQRGYPTMLGAETMACVGLSAMFVEPVVGFLLDRYDDPRRIFPLYLFGICGLLLVVYAKGAPMFLLAGWLMGFSIGGQFTAMSYLLSRYFGVRDLGKISGIAYGVSMLTTSIFMIGLNAMYDAIGVYGPAMLAVSPILLWNTVVPWLLGRYPKEANSLQIG